MDRRIILVRAVNVGGTQLPMAEFRELLSGLGAESVSTYIASGNAIAEVPGDPEVFDRAVETALTARYGWVREVLSRSRAELVAARAAHPFEVLDPSASYVSFLTAVPGEAALAAAAEVPRGDDEWRVIGRELHLRYANGAGRATLQQERLAKTLGVAATARNLRTVDRLIALAAG